MSEYLIDLDELVLRCKDKEARKYIAEAVACYKSGAFRACIVTTWIAVVYDFVYKLRQLELTGDKNAITKIALFEQARKHKNPDQALQFEKKILEWARDEFEFLSELQFLDLERLLMDRNRCAHPSMISAEEIYQPPAELARYHLRNAIVHLLQHPPVQGQAALERLKNETLSEYFPVDTEKAVRYFAHGPLANPKPALIENFAKALMKALLLEDYDVSQWQRFTAALNALRQMHRPVAEQVFFDQLSIIIQRLPDKNFDRVVRLLNDVHDTWQFLLEDVRTKTEVYVENISVDQIWIINSALEIPELQTKALLRLQSVNSEQLSQLIGEVPRKEYVDRAIQLYATAGSFASANTMGERLIIPLVPHLEYKHLQKIISAAIPPHNGRYPNQVFESSSFQRQVLPKIVETHNLSGAALRKLLDPLREAHPQSDLWISYFPDDYLDEEY